MDIQDLKITAGQMRSLIIAMINVDTQNNKSMTKNHGKQIKDDAKYEALRRGGASKEKAARIANSPNASKKGGKSSPMEERTKPQLLEEAKKIGIKGRYKMTKGELIAAVRNH
ncbi:DUF7218 family protein [Sphingobacterium yanglingense]|uniref:Rho termination factor-like protein n=1 Tax=Sphingobacterium yanglingense TaxID=1437280 RepID=A0A4R6WPC7_9SPHI|nr:Rho termination factor [Sphingobacterium yanglingense]TDQ80001.1 Rho termination factor-like protein [Sphingobacterium yanglingense]